jgi:DDE superfamily endonuclease
MRRRCLVGFIRFKRITLFEPIKCFQHALTFKVELGEAHLERSDVALRVLRNHRPTSFIRRRIQLEIISSKRRRKVGVPDEISFKTKPEIALAQIRWACEAGLLRGVVLMDAGAARAPVRTCVMAEGLFADGIGWVVLARTLPSGQVGASFFLVDVWCLGVKDAWAASSRCLGDVVNVPGCIGSTDVRG